MKSILFITFLIFFYISTKAQLADTLNRKDEKGKQGHWIYYGKDRPEAGVVFDGKVEEGTYIDDRKEGKWIKYHLDGVTPKLIGQYENNRPTAHYKKFYSSGQLREEGNFIQNQYRDSLIRYYENGQREYASFTDSTGKTLWESYWNPDGTPREKLVEFAPNCSDICVSKSVYTGRLPILNDPGDSPNTLGIDWKPNGTNKVYSENGILIMEGKFKRGILSEGKLYYYDYKGELYTTYLIKNGRFVQEIE